MDIEHETKTADSPAAVEVVKQTSNAVQLGALGASTPAGLVTAATDVANALAGVIQQQGLISKIQGRDYVSVEGWTTLATMLGITAQEVETTEKDGIYTSVVALVRMTDGAVIARGSAECGDEKPWNGRPRYARRSMAQTRATGKACRLAFSWIMKLAGYEATPAEEMSPVDDSGPTQADIDKLTAEIDRLNKGWARWAEQSAPIADQMADRIEQISNVFELKNWSKKHANEINNLHPESKQAIFAIGKSKNNTLNQHRKTTEDQVPEAEEQPA